MKIGTKTLAIGIFVMAVLFLASCAKTPTGTTESNHSQLTISGRLQFGESKNPISGVQVAANNGGSSAVSDEQGRYVVSIPYGWSGELMFSKEGMQLPRPISFGVLTEDVVIR